MASLEELEGLSYRELQGRCREVGLRATGKYEELVQRLLEGTDGATGGEPPASARKSRASRAETAKTPRTSRKAAPPAAADSPAVDKAALLRAAASTPLPTKPRPEEEDEDGPSVRQASSAKRRPQQPTGKGRAARGGPASPVFWALLLTTAAAGLASLGVPYCQQNDCAELARNLPELAADGAAAAYGAARARALVAADAAQARWHELAASLANGGTNGGAGATHRPAGCEFDARAALQRIMPAGERFAALHTTAAYLLSSQTPEPADKAAVALFACQAETDCHAAVRELDQAVADGQRCVLHLDGRHLGDDKGSLQEQLAKFLRAVPTGIVVLRRIDQMSPELLPVLINALSEGGAFEQDGKPVSTIGATFLLTSLMPADVFAALDDEVRFKQEAKTRLVVDLALRAADKDAAKMHASALRRRVDLVIPIASQGAGGTPEEALAAE